MSKFQVTSYGNGKSILKFPEHFVSASVTVSDAGITMNSDGRKIVPAGTVVGGGVLADNTKTVTEHNTQGAATGAAGAGADAEGVLLNDADVTFGPAPCAMLIHGFVNTVNLPVAPCADAVKALAGRIVFMQ